MAHRDDIPHLRLVTSPADLSPSAYTRRQASCEGGSHLRLVTSVSGPAAIEPPIASPEVRRQLSLFPGLFDATPSLLGFLNMSLVSDRTFTFLVRDMRPRWLLDLRPVPRFDYGRLTRRRAFRLFSENDVRYLDIAGGLNIRERHDPRLGAGTLSRELNALLVRSAQKLIGPVVVLVDDPSVLLTAKEIIPKTLEPRPKRGWVPRIITMQGERYFLID